MLAAAGAPLGLVFGVWRPMLWWLPLIWLLGLLAAALIDMLRLPRAKVVLAAVAVPSSVAVGESFAVTLTVAAPAALRLVSVALAVPVQLAAAADGFADIALHAGPGTTTVPLTALRRGSVAFGRLDVRWSGPFGLVRRQKHVAATAELLIAPDIRPLASLGARLLAEDARDGLSLQPWLGDSGVFDSLVEYRTGVDRRRIDWKASARHSALLAKEHTVERDNAVVLAVDCGRLMCEPIDGLARIDRAVTAALLTGYVALKSGDRVGLFGFDARPRQVTAPRAGMRSFAALQRAAGALDYAAEETNFALSLSELGKRLDRRSLVVLFTDFVDTTSAELMLRATARLRQRHLIVAVVFRDAELEALAAAEPREPDDIARSVVAAGLLQERRVVLARLRQLGVDVIEAAYAEAGPALVRRYLDIKARGRL